MNKTFVALDGMTRQEAIKLVTEYPQITHIKIGLELYLRYGTELIMEMAAIRDLKIFLDMKLHDIPTTVAKAIAGLKGLPISYLTVHATGGKEMLKMAQDSIEESISGCKLLAVTILTSHDENQIKSIWGRKKELALCALLDEINGTGVAGLVCSGEDLEVVLKYEESNKCKFIKVTPGIRLAGDSANDQVRVMTPLQAIEHGSDFLVVGRSITKNPSVIKQNIFP